MLTLIFVHLNSLAPGLFCILFCMSSTDFFQNRLFSKNSFRNTIRVSNSLDSDQADILSGLIWVQIVCEGYLQTTLGDKELTSPMLILTFSCLLIRA